MPHQDLGGSFILLGRTLAVLLQLLASVAMDLGMLPVLASGSLVGILHVGLIVLWLDGLFRHSGYLLVYQVSAGFRLRRSLDTESMKKGREDRIFLAAVAEWVETDLGRERAVLLSIVRYFFVCGIVMPAILSNFPCN